MHIEIIARIGEVPQNRTLPRPAHVMQRQTHGERIGSAAPRDRPAAHGAIVDGIRSAAQRTTVGYTERENIDIEFIDLSGPISDRRAPFCAHSTCTSRLIYSITSSARPRSEIGIVMPRAVAVLRLMISSTFVDCCTGMSAGFSPLRIRPV